MFWAFIALAAIAASVAVLFWALRGNVPRPRPRRADIDDGSPARQFDTGDAWMLGLPATTRHDTTGGFDAHDPGFAGGGSFGGGGASSDWSDSPGEDGDGDSGGGDAGGSDTGGGDRRGRRRRRRRLRHPQILT